MQTRWAVLRCAVLFGAVLCCAVLQAGWQVCFIQVGNHHFKLDLGMLCCGMPCCAVLCCSIVIETLKGIVPVQLDSAHDRELPGPQDSLDEEEDEETNLPRQDIESGSLQVRAEVCAQLQAAMQCSFMHIWFISITSHSELKSSPLPIATVCCSN